MDRPILFPACRRAGVAVLGVAVALGLLAGLLLWPPSPARADDSSVGGVGGTYYPLTNTDVRMESETVQAIIYRHFAEYRADFLFDNSGPAQTLMLGFPFATDPEDEGSHPVAFRAWQDGKPLAVSIGQGAADSYENYYLHQADFPSGKTTITVSYLARASWVSSARFPELQPSETKVVDYPGIEGFYEYWLHTGAGWAGTIGKAVIRFTLADDFPGYGMDVKAADSPASPEWPMTTRPETYTKVDDRTYQWVFTDLEPAEKDDIVFEFTGVEVYPGDTKTVPAALGAVVMSLETSNPASPDGDWETWAIIDGSASTAIPLKGEHPWVRMGIEGDRNLREIRIVPGRNDAVDSFGRYSRPKTLKLTMSNGTTSTITLKDEPTLQRFPVSATTEWVRFDVVDSYPGSQSGDICIADISFGNEQAPSFASFDDLMAAAFPMTVTSSGPPGGSSSTTAAASATTAGSTASTATPSTATSNASTASSATTITPSTWNPTVGDTDPASALGVTSIWTGWAIALLAVACVAFLTAGVLLVLLLRRHRARPRSGPLAGPGPGPGEPPQNGVVS